MSLLAPSSFSFKAMGCPCELRSYTANAEVSARAFAAAVSEINRLDLRYSSFLPDNLLATVNDAACQGSSIEVDDELTSLLEFADTCYTQSEGLFDITTGSLSAVWSGAAGRLPTQSMLAQALESVGWDKVSWQNNRLNFSVPNMKIDFGGIVKEYAVDRAASILMEHGLQHGCVDLGGDIRVVGPRPDGAPWRVGIRHPRRPEAQMATIDIIRGALASSGDYERYIEIDGQQYGHIISPITGWPIRGLATVSVVAEQCVVAGSLCTTAMLKGLDGPDWLSGVDLPHLWMDERGNCGGTSSEQNPAVHWHTEEAIVTHGTNRDDG